MYLLHIGQMTHSNTSRICKSVTSHKKPERKGVALGKVRALEKKLLLAKKKKRKKKKTSAVGQRKSKGAPARDTRADARDKKEKNMPSKDGNKMTLT